MQSPMYDLFPDFYSNDFIRKIADKPKWTVSDKDKKPIDINALAYLRKIWGADFREIGNPPDQPGLWPTTTLDKTLEIIPNIANHAFYLNALEDGYVIADIEPGCPEDMKKKFLNTDYIYGEMSLSGKGIHLVYPLPKCLNEYPNAKNKIVFKEPTHGYYEIHLAHWVTFTRNMIPLCENPTEDFTEIFREMASQQKAVTTREVDIEVEEPEDIPNGKQILSILSNAPFKRDPSEFLKNDGTPDTSKYEYGYMGHIYNNLKRILGSKIADKDHEYTDNERAWLMYYAAQKLVPPRPKHEEARYGMPWLLFLASSILSRNAVNKEETDGKRQDGNKQ